MLKRRIELDLFLIDILTLALVLTAFTFTMPWLRLILGFPFILFFPGYILVVMLFPRKESLGATARVALSLGLSVAVSIFIGLMLNFTLWGISVYPLVLSISLFILLTSGIAWYLRERINQEERFSVSLRLPLDSLRHSLKIAGKGYRSLVIILLCAILGGSGALGYVMTRPMVRQPSTEFYILGMEGRAEGYPLELRPGEESKVMVGIVNHEREEIDYRLEVTVDRNKLYELPPMRLKPEEKWQGEVGFTLQKIGNSQKVEFLLYKGRDQPYEIRYLWVNIRA